jgi:protein required for attachment to host cells
MSMTWIMVADEVRARLFCRDRHGMVELEDFRSAQCADQDGAEAPPRVPWREAPGATCPQVDAGEPAGNRFARRLSQVLERGRLEHRYDDLVLVAPAAFLGTLTAALSKRVSGRVVRRIDKDLTRDPVTRLRGTLGASH